MLGLSQSEQVVALLPGSRVSEIERLAPIFFAAAVKSLRSMPKLRFLIPLAVQKAGPVLSGRSRGAVYFLASSFASWTIRSKRWQRLTL